LYIFVSETEMRNMDTLEQVKENLTFSDFKTQILADYMLCRKSREASLIARKEVLTGKSKFGIMGDGKELPQIAMAKVFRNGDFRSGYYRDQTFCLAAGLLTIEEFFAQIYADTDLKRDSHSAGRQMNCHFSTHSLDENGEWKNLTQQKNSSADISCTAGQMPRLLGLAQASKIYKGNKNLAHLSNFSNNGNEIAFGTIGDGSTAEGHFWETINAACTLQVPMLLSIWDDGYGISVPHQFQRSKKDLSLILEGFRRTETEKGCEIFQVNGWDYPALIDVYSQAEKIVREEQIPVIIHVKELTQPQGHSTSGSHERYKDATRLQFEKEFDCLDKFKEWILEFTFFEDNTEISLATEDEISKIDEQAKQEVKKAHKQAWNEYQNSIKMLYNNAIELINTISSESNNANFIQLEISKLNEKHQFQKKYIFQLVRKVLTIVRGENLNSKIQLINWLENQFKIEQRNYSSHLYSESQYAAIKIAEIPIQYEENAPEVDGRIVVRDNFEVLFNTYPELMTFGEDVGAIGDVNQGFEGLQQKFGSSRIADTGIRENTIIGQGIGLAMRGLRPIAEIQYLDYILYGLQTLSDDLATLHYRSVGRQKAPLIVRTRGHRLEGIWHAGSPMGGLAAFLKGIVIAVPRDLTRAAGFYNTMIQSDDPCLIIESLNGYRIKEKLPSNLGKFTIPIGKIEITKAGNDITLVTYGSTWRIVMEAAKELQSMGIDAEVIDIQTLMPLDISHQIVESIKKTNRILVIDEDIPGGGSAYIMNEILEKQKAFKYLDSEPQTLCAKKHRPAFGSDGDYFSKPSKEDIIEKVYSIIREVKPLEFPKIF